MIAESIKRDVCAELSMCKTRRDIRRTFTSAQKDFQRRSVPMYRRQQVLKEMREGLKAWLGADEKKTELVLEAQVLIDGLLLANA